MPGSIGTERNEDDATTQVIGHCMGEVGVIACIIISFTFTHLSDHFLAVQWYLQRRMWRAWGLSSSCDQDNFTSPRSYARFIRSLPNRSRELQTSLRGWNGDYRKSASEDWEYSRFLRSSGRWEVCWTVLRAYGPVVKSVAVQYCKTRYPLSHLPWHHAPVVWTG